MNKAVHRPRARPFAIARSVASRYGSRARYALKSAIGQFTFAALAFGASVLTARLLGPSGKGALTAWTLLATIAPVLAGGAIPVGLGRTYLDGRGDEVFRAMAKHGVVVLAGASLVSVIALTLGADPIGLLAFVVVCIPCGAVYLDFSMVTQAAKLPWLYHSGRVAGAALYAVGLSVLAILGRHNEQHLIWGVYAGGIAVSTLAVLVVFARRFGARRGVSLKDAAQAGRGSFWAVPLDLIVLRLDQGVVLSIVGTAGLGIYGVAVNWSEVSKYFGDAFGQAVFEDESTLDTVNARRILRRITTYLTGISLVVAASGFILIPPLFGRAFSEARWALLLLAPGLIARGVSHAGSWMLMARGRAAVVSRILGIVVLGAIPVWLVATALFGINGAAAASTLVYAAQAGLIVRAFTA